MIQLDFGKIFRHVDDDFAPQTTCRQDVGFVDGRNFAATKFSRLEGELCDSFDFGHGINFGVPCLFNAVFSLRFATRSEVNAAD